MKEGGWLDVPAFLEYTRQVLLERASYAIASLDPDDLSVGPAGVQWKNVSASGIIFCQGWRGHGIVFSIGFRCDRRRRHPRPRDSGTGRDPRIVNGGGWLVPVGGNRFRAGATYHHGARDTPSLELSREEVLAKIAALTPAVPEVTGHRRALRPTIRRSQVFLGTHPAIPASPTSTDWDRKGPSTARGMPVSSPGIFSTELPCLRMRSAGPVSLSPPSMSFPRVTETAHDLVARFVREGDHVIDATVGNGHDTGSSPGWSARRAC